MNNLEYYISTKYKNNPLWFQDEVKQGYHASRIAKAYSTVNIKLKKERIWNLREKNLRLRN